MRLMTFWKWNKTETLIKSIEQRGVVNRLFVILALGIFLSISACHFNSSFNNRLEDKHEGEQVVEQFYESLKRNDFRNSYSFFSSNFFEVTDSQKLAYIFSITVEKLGKLESFSIDHWETEAVVGTDPGTNYLFVCEVKRSKFLSKETIRLSKKDGKVKIVGYQVNSDGFFTAEENVL